MTQGSSSTQPSSGPSQNSGMSTQTSNSTTQISIASTQTLNASAQVPNASSQVPGSSSQAPGASAQISGAPAQNQQPPPQNLGAQPAYMRKTHLPQILDKLRTLPLKLKLSINKDIKQENEHRAACAYRHALDPVANPDPGSEAASMITLSSRMTHRV